MTATAAAPGGRPRRTISDWAGFVLISAFALTFPLSGGRSALLLLPPMLYEFVVAATFLVRGRARRTMRGAGPRVAAYGVSFLIPVFLWSSIHWMPALTSPSQSPSLRSLGATVWLAGTLLSFWPVWSLRRSFSIEPVARELATTGPYAYARHPIYGTQILIYAGMLLLHATPAFAVVFAVWLVLLHFRVGYEEHVLSAEYPEYDVYRQRVGAFAPRMARVRPAPTHE